MIFHYQKHTVLNYCLGIRDPEKTYSGSGIQGSKSTRIPDPDPQHFGIVGSGIQDLGQGREKIWIRDKHPGSAALNIMQRNILCPGAYFIVLQRIFSWSSIVLFFFFFLLGED
jgi:hypothetical protein